MWFTRGSKSLEGMARRSNRVGPPGSGLFGGHGLLGEFDFAARVVGHRKHLVELDQRLHAVALHDAVPPWSGVERLGVFDALPLVHAARPTAFAPDEVLADQALHRAEAWCDLVKVLAACGVVDVRRQFVAHRGGNHVMSSPEWSRHNGGEISRAGQALRDAHRVMRRATK